ncbi:RrF2 family transcriptional regulator [Chitinophagaceae bacterium MMS25-I14]
MRLNQFTDIGLRAVLYLSLRPERNPATITELAQQFNISRNHLVKVIQFLSQKQVLLAHRGRGGGLSLARPATEYKIGDLIRTLEQNEKIIDCEGLECVLNGQCHLKHLLFRAQTEFYNYLNNYTLADVAQTKTKDALFKMYENIGALGYSPAY